MTDGPRARPSGLRTHVSVYKVTDLLAHTADVLAVHVGRKSGDLMATGADDRKVNVWRISTGANLLSLSGHTSPVECLAFEHAEDKVVAGSSGGTLKLWDLERGKVARTLTGHRSNCQCVGWHPYGEFFASGSIDTNLKVWDIRRKACIQTYKGHARGVSCLRFSPDGRWVVSGGDDGSVRLWDLTMGKMLAELQPPSAPGGPCSSLAFHPSEFLMAAVGGDRSVRFYDLETFELVDSAPPDMFPPRAVAFSADGSALYAATDDGMRVHGWEPARLLDHVEARGAFGALADVCELPEQSQLLAVSARDAAVSVWGVDLAMVRPWAREVRRTHSSGAVLSGGGGGCGGVAGVQHGGATAEPAGGGLHSPLHSPPHAQPLPSPPTRSPLHSPSAQHPAAGRRSAGSSRARTPTRERAAAALAAAADELTPAAGMPSRELHAAAAGGRARGAAAGATPAAAVKPPFATDLRASAAARDAAAGGAGTPAGGAAAEAAPPRQPPAAQPRRLSNAAARPPAVVTQSPGGASGGISAAAATAAAKGGGALVIAGRGQPSGGGPGGAAARRTSEPSPGAAMLAAAAAADAAGQLPTQSMRAGWGVPSPALELSAVASAEEEEGAAEEEEEEGAAAHGAGDAAAAGRAGARGAARASGARGANGTPAAAAGGARRPSVGRRASRDGGGGGDGGGGNGGGGGGRGSVDLSESGQHREIGTSTGESLRGDAAMDAAAIAKALALEKRGAEARRAADERARRGRNTEPRAGGASGGGGGGSGRDLNGGVARLAGAGVGAGVGAGAGAGAPQGHAAAPAIIPAERSAPLGLDPAQFLPHAAGGGAAALGGAAGAELDAAAEEIAISEMVEPSSVQLAVLSARLTAVRAVLAFWAAGDVRGALAHLAKLGDTAVTADFVRSGALRSCASLEHAASVLPLLRSVLAQSPFEEHLEAATTAGTKLLADFGPLIAETRAAAAGGGHAAAAGGVDLSAEERLRRCDACHAEFARLHDALLPLTAQRSRVRQPAIDLRRRIEKRLGIGGGEGAPSAVGAAGAAAPQPS